MPFFARRLLAVVPTLLLVSFIVFLLVHLSPGDPAVRAAGGQDATPEAIAAARERLGLNDPFLVQYGNWMLSLLQGDLGTSLFSSQKVTEAILPRLPVTLSLTLGAAIVAVLLSIPIGTIAALRSGGLSDRMVMLGASLGIAMPNFFIGLLLVLGFALSAGWLPATGWVAFSDSPGGWISHMILPSVTLGIAVAAELARHLRASLRDVLDQDYVRTASAKGLSSVKVVGKHGLKNAAIPVVTVFGLQVQHLLGGTVVVEQIFGLPGLGSLAVQAVFDRNYTVIQGIAVVTVLIVLIINFLVDLSYAYLNPRIRLT